MKSHMAPLTDRSSLSISLSAFSVSRNRAITAPSHDPRRQFLRRPVTRHARVPPRRHERGDALLVSVRDDRDPREHPGDLRLPPLVVELVPDLVLRRRGNAEGGEPMRERPYLGGDHVDRPGHVHAGRRHRGLRQGSGPRGGLRLAAPVQRVVRAQPGRIRDLERGHQQVGIEQFQVGVGDLVAVTGPVGQELDNVPPVQPRRPSAAMRLLVRRDRRQPVIEHRQRGPSAEGVLLVLCSAGRG